MHLSEPLCQRFNNVSWSSGPLSTTRYTFWTICQKTQCLHSPWLFRTALFRILSLKLFWSLKPVVKTLFAGLSLIFGPITVYVVSWSKNSSRGSQFLMLVAIYMWCSMIINFFEGQLISVNSATMYLLYPTVVDRKKGLNTRNWSNSWNRRELRTPGNGFEF